MNTPLGNPTTLSWSLPLRTDHAIRNRWHRLQTMHGEQQQRRLAQGGQVRLPELPCPRELRRMARRSTPTP